MHAPITSKGPSAASGRIVFSRAEQSQSAAGVVPSWSDKPVLKS
jgi:hypothetical protein